MSVRLLLTSTMLVLSGCAEPELSAEVLQALEMRAADLSSSLREQATGESTGIVVKLMFDESVDLDLYVTDPLLETVYFARHESRTGGVISEDVRCDTVGPRVEEVRFPRPWPGRYRVGVDFPSRCDGSTSRAPAPYAVSVTANGNTHETQGLVDLEYFDVIVLEFEISESQTEQGDL